ncbi:MAG: isochorismatase family cysteine hydrolase [Butyricicoccus sp.]|nr:isochorismatase family cysteine hydrolase [Butyricicoccus sp.]
MKKLLAVIDYQNDFVSGALGFPGAETIDHGIAHLVQAWLAMGDQVLFTLDTHQEDYLQTREGLALPIPHCLAGSFGAQLYGETQALCCETCANAQIHVVHKRSFGMDPADALRLRERIGEDVTEIQIVGLVTNLCVISNAILLQSTWPNAQITVDASLCGSSDLDLQQKALDVLKGLQIHVIHE